jgi:hypothetical protein
MRDVETALVRLRRATDEASSGEPGEPGQPGEPRQPGEPSEPGQPSEPSQPSEPGQPGEPDEPGGLAEAERRLADLRAAHHALQEASARLGTATSAALSDQGRRVVRLRRARDTANHSRAANANSTAEAGGAAVAGGAALADTGAPPAQRSGSRLLFAPSLIAVGIVGTLLVSLAVNAGIDPFRGQPLTPPPAAADGTGAGAPAIALPPVQKGTAKARTERSAGSRRREMSRSARRAQTLRAARGGRAGRPSR